MVAASDDASQAAAGAQIVAVTAVAWSGYATAGVRDAFLAALDEQNEARTIAIARHILRCRNPLPSATCAALGVAPGSSYGAGAQAFLVRARVSW